jgi:hypothetical protein
VSTATNRMHQLVTDLYESLHTDNGSPQTRIDVVIGLTNNFRRLINEELDLVRESVTQYLEDHDQQREA